MFSAGADWADDHHDVTSWIRVAAWSDPREYRIRRRAWPSSGLSCSAPPETLRIPCFVETKHGLLVSSLLEAGFPVYPVNPKTVDRHRKASGAKTDAIDAYLLARRGRSDLADLRRLEPDSPVVQELKALTRDQDTLIRYQTSLVNQLTACLKAYYPAALELLCKLQQPPAQSDGGAHHAQAPRAAPQGGCHDDPDQSLSHAGPGRPAGVPARQIRAHDREIDRLYESHLDSELFSSLPGAGKRLAPRLLAGWSDDRSRYASAASIQALAGTSPVAYHSGNYRKVPQEVRLREGVPQHPAPIRLAVHSLRGGLLPAQTSRG